MSATDERDLVARLAKRDPEAAMARARSIRDPWFRAQALAWVARFAPGDEVVQVAEESLAAGRECEDAFRSVGSAAWPIRALIEREHADLARRVVGVARSQLAGVDPTSSRSEAAFLLYQAAFGLGPETRLMLVQDLAAIHASDDHWKASRHLVDAIHMLAATETARASVIASGIADERTRRQAAAKVDAGDVLEARSFFW